MKKLFIVFIVFVSLLLCVIWSVGYGEKHNMQVVNGYVDKVIAPEKDLGENIAFLNLQSKSITFEQIFNVYDRLSSENKQQILSRIKQNISLETYYSFMDTLREQDFQHGVTTEPRLWIHEDIKNLYEPLINQEDLELRSMKLIKDEIYRINRKQHLIMSKKELIANCFWIIVNNYNILVSDRNKEAMLKYIKIYIDEEIYHVCMETLRNAEYDNGFQEELMNEDIVKLYQ